MATRTPYPGTESSSDFLTTTNFDKLPGGLIGYAKVTTPTQSFTTSTALTGLTLTLTPVTASRNLYIQWYLPLFCGSAGGAGEGVNIALQKDGSQVAFDGCPVASGINSSTTFSVGGFHIDVAPTLASHTYALVGARFGSSSSTYTLNVSATTPAWLAIWDEGVTF